MIEWDRSVRPDGTYDPVAPQGGCLRTLPPCAGWFGVRQQLEAVAAAQRDHPGGYRLLAVPMYTPARFAARGCGETRSRPPRDLGAYRAMIRAVEAEADRAGVEIEGWAPWNEPNHPYFMCPGRTASVKPYVRLARALREEVGDRLVMGELAGHLDMAAFVARLPRDLVCAARVFTVHDYAGGDDALADLDLPCDVPVWVTETGAMTDRFTPEEACRADRRNLERWSRDPRVEAVFHYTLREDDRFPTGLVTTDLRRAYPVLEEWQAWAGSSSPPPSSC